MIFGAPLSAAEAAVFETFVVPRYLSFFGSLAVNLFLPHDSAVIAHLGCRTGYPDGLLAERFPGAQLIGVDPSPAALELARTKAALLSNVRASYQPAEVIPTAMPDESFTHALTLHPNADTVGRGQVLAELRRLLTPGGQAVIGLPLRGSFPEIADMIREYSLRQDLPEVGQAVDVAMASRPTIETVAEELENAGLTEVDVDVQLIAISFDSGREFLDDPITKLMVMPEIRSILRVEVPTMENATKYVHEAIGKYWSEGVFELTVNVGAASGRKLS